MVDRCGREGRPRRIAAIPGVTSVGASQHLPLSGFNWFGSLDIEATPIAATATHPRVTWRSITGDYFAAMRVPLVRGRTFTSADTRDAPPVVIINAGVSQRTRELGIRSALGAMEGRIVRMIVGEGARLATIGIVLGVFGAIVAARSLKTLVYGVETSDPVLYAFVAAVLAGVAVAASVIPARRASRVDPLIALRGE